jgi:NAD(P)H dehydrogenase (quinone)
LHARAQGPEAEPSASFFSPIVSGPEKAAIVSEGLSQAGLPPFVVDAVAEIEQTFVQGYFDILTSDIERLSGRAPQSFSDVLTAALSKGGTR